ncbi:MAG: sensor histidine kinase [Negativicutes bacterium]
MKAETNKLELILSHMDNAVILMDRYGRVTAANKMARDSFGITSEMLGQHNLQVIGNSYLDRAVREAITASTDRLIDLKTRLQGNKRVFQVYLAPITGSHSEVTGLLSVFHDITALQQVQEKQSEFIANASHELATPLTAIKGFAETLLDGALHDPNLNTKFITIIHSEAERMQRLVADLLTMAKLDSQEYRRAMILKPTLFAPLVDEVIQELSPEWQTKNIKIGIAANDASLSALANPDCLKQVLINLIDNAIKYTSSGGKISIRTWRQNNKAYLSVQDSGIGIPARRSSPDF